MSFISDLDLPLGKTTEYIDRYNPNILCPIPRTANRSEWSDGDLGKMYGWDIWYGFELNYLNAKEQPVQARIHIMIPADSANLVESKSMKLYLYALRNTVFSTPTSLEKMITSDLSVVVGAQVEVQIILDKHWELAESLPGNNIDDLDVRCVEYQPNTDLIMLETDNTVQNYEINSNLLESNCLVTGQPDWASVYIKYSGHKINDESMLRYLVSYRCHKGFHEHCVEKIFFDILKKAQPKELTVYAQYTRRGGLAIAPYRSTSDSFTCFPLLWRT